MKISPHRLIDILEPSEKYSIAKFQKDVLFEIHQAFKNNRIPLLVGGSMLYFKSLLNGIPELPPSNIDVRRRIKKSATYYSWTTLHKRLQYIDKHTADRIHPNDAKRISRALEIFYVSGKKVTDILKAPKKKIPYKIYQFGIAPINRLLLHKRIEKRLDKMLYSGFEDEVKYLFLNGILNEYMPAIRCIGYNQMWEYIKHNITYKAMLDKTICATRQLAKKQTTWLRRWKGIHWLSADTTSNLNTMLNIIKNECFFEHISYNIKR